MAEKWQLSQLRFTAFSGNPLTDCAAKFEAFFGFPSDSQSSQKTNFLTAVSAQRDNTLYQVVATGPKLDVTVTAAYQIGGVPQALPSIAQPEQTRQSFITSSFGLLDQLQQIRRLAVGEQYLLPASSRIDAYQRMSPFLPSVKVDPQGSSDFFYRINRSRTSQFGGSSVKINRLSQWGCIVLTVLAEAAGISQATAIADAVSLATDVNSQAETDVSTLGKPEQKTLLETLFAFSAEIAEKGDLP